MSQFTAFQCGVVITAPPAELLMHLKKIITFALIHLIEEGTNCKKHGVVHLHSIREQEVKMNLSLIGSFSPQRRVGVFWVMNNRKGNTTE